MKLATRHTGYFEVEEPILDLLGHLRILRETIDENDPDLQASIVALEDQVEALQRDIYGSLSPWEKVQMARHPRRPRFMEYVNVLCASHEELRGDRLMGEDPAIRMVLGDVEGQTWLIAGNDRGTTPEEAEAANDAMARPEAFHKMIRGLGLAQRFEMPVLTLVDTPGPAQGVEAEERGQAPTIARCLAAFSDARVPTISVLTGEGGSGGAIALALTDRVYAQTNAIYSVISPEGCAAIIYRDANRAPEAAERLRLTAEDLYRFGIIDGIIAEPLGGAHISPERAAQVLKEEVRRGMEYLSSLGMERRRQERYARFRTLGGS